MNLTENEAVFATENHGIVLNYLRYKRLPPEEWYDVVIFRYLRAVCRYCREPELRKWKFATIANRAMDSAVFNEKKKQDRRIQTVSIDTEIQGTEGLTYADIVTEENLIFTDYLERRIDMQIRYNVKLPPKSNFYGSKKSDERIAIEAFLEASYDNMAFEYDMKEEAKKKQQAIREMRRRYKETELYESYRVDRAVFVVRTKKGKEE